MDMKRSKGPTGRRIDVKVGKHERQLYLAAHINERILFEHSRGTCELQCENFFGEVGLQTDAAKSLIKWFEDRAGRFLTNCDISRLEFLMTKKQ